MGKPGKKAGAGMQPPTKTDRRVDSGKAHLRDQRTIKRLKMYQSKVVRNEKGEIVKGSVLSASDRVQQSMARVAPDRRWFGNTRVIGQQALQEFREEMGAKYHDPYSVIVRQSKLPLSLLNEPKGPSDAKQDMQWAATFGDKATRKRVNLNTASVEQLSTVAQERGEAYASGKKRDRNLLGPDAEFRADATNNRKLFKKGQSTRIWNELHKVIDSADVLLYVVDARDPMGTRSAFVEEYMRTEKKYKHFVFVLNKCDLIPLWATARWLQILSKDFPTVAFHASVNHPFGKGSLISLLRQFSRLHNVTHRGNKRTKAPISVGIVGYPNVGKSSVINTLRRKSVCKVAPIPGETKVWQYVALTRSIFLIDCPGIVYDREGNDDINAVLKGVVRVERLGAADKSDVVHAVFDIVKDKDLRATYQIREWSSPTDFLEQLAVRRGKLLQGGVPDLDIAARMVLYDWQRGKLPWFKEPPFDSAAQRQQAEAVATHATLSKIEELNELNVVEDHIQAGGGDSDAQSDDVPGEPLERAVDPTLGYETLATVAAAREKSQKKAKRQVGRRATGTKVVPEVAALAAASKAEANVEEAAWASFLAAAET